MSVENVYGGVLFDLWLESKNQELFFEKIKLLFEHVINNQDFFDLILNPDINFGDKKNFLDKLLLDNKMPESEKILNFFLLLIKNQRLTYIRLILESFFDLYYEYKNILRVRVLSKVKLSDNMVFDIQKFLELKYKKEIDIQNIIDSGLIGGFIIEFDGTVIDCSLDKKLNDLKTYLNKVNIAV